ncbi:MAG: 3-dehydroquinate synthase [Candidatus Omnitrophica bacterium CG11_big_fil_rev_8_21_14_0_20_64_10]|nr:MAG: 3-dehydroquinate synthase [Candidatus Omnitrophica bacterium CG11_big_fil_rev_8_21_14_0_20_64_10]
MAIREVPVRLAGRGYRVRIGHGHTAGLGRRLKKLRLGTHPVLVTNRTVWVGPGRVVWRSLRAAGFAPEKIFVPDGEKAKSLSQLGRLLNRLADLDSPEKQLFLVLVGGGVVGDLGGLTAGLYRRGIPFVQVPTSLLAQVDASIGGKTGVDLPHGKNLVGLIVQPREVHIDTAFLATLSERQFRSGLAEILKCGVIADAILFARLERRTLAQLRRPADLTWIIARAVRVKAAVVARDEFERKGIRLVLNFGHTLGHALEAAVGYSRRVTHGEAVAVGMRAATRLAAGLGMIGSGPAGRVEALLDRYGFSSGIGRGVPETRLFRAMSHDKKWSAGVQRWILLTGIGRAAVRRDVPVRLVRSVVRGLRG